MGKKFTNMKAAKKSFAENLKLRDWTSKFINNNGSKNPAFINDLHVDPRDLCGITLLWNFGHNEFKTQEEFEKALTEVVDLLKTDKNKVFDKIYDVYDSYNPITADVSTAQGRRDALAFYGMSQGFGVILEKNPEYKEARYMQSLQSQKQLDANIMRGMAVLQTWLDEFKEGGMNLGQSEYYSKEEMKYLVTAFTEYDKENFEFHNSALSESCDVLSGKKDVAEIEIPYYFGQMEPLFKAEADALAQKHWYRGSHTGDFFQKFSFAFCYSNTCTSDVTQKVLHQECGEQNIFVDGKSITEGLEKGENNQEYLMNLAKSLYDAIKDGQVIEAVSSYMVNGELKHIVTPVKFKVTKDLQNYSNDQYAKENNIGWVHRTFFDWGPWKIQYPDLSQQYNKGFLADTKESREAREAAILEHMEKDVNPKYYENKALILEEQAKKNAAKITAPAEEEKKNLIIDINVADPEEEKFPQDAMNKEDDILVEDVPEK